MLLSFTPQQISKQTESRSRRPFHLMGRLVNNQQAFSMMLGRTGDWARCSSSQSYLLTKNQHSDLFCHHSCHSHGHLPVIARMACMFLSSLCHLVFISRCLTCSHLPFYLPYPLLAHYSPCSLVFFCTECAWIPNKPKLQSFEFESPPWWQSLWMRSKGSVDRRSFGTKKKIMNKKNKYMSPLKLIDSLLNG